MPDLRMQEKVYGGGKRTAALRLPYLRCSNDRRYGKQRALGVTRRTFIAATLYLRPLKALIIHRLIHKGFAACHAVFFWRLAEVAFKHCVHILQRRITT